MKILIKIASLTLLTVCLQVNAAQVILQPGPATFIANCSIPSVQGARYLAKPFKEYYGLDPAIVCTPTVMQMVKDIQAFVDIAANFTGGDFTSATAAGNFVTLIGNSTNLFSGTIFPKFGGLSYYALAKNKLEAELTTQTTSAQTLKPIAQNLDEVLPTPTPAGTTRAATFNPTDTLRLSKAVSDDIIDALSYLNTMQQTWDPTTAAYVPAPIAATDPNQYHRGPLVTYMNHTFGTALRELMTAQAQYLQVTPLVEATPGALAITNLDPTTPAVSFSMAMIQAAPIIKAMADQIIQVDTLVSAVTLPTGAAALPVGPLSDKVEAALEQTTIATVEPLVNIASLIGYTMPAAGTSINANTVALYTKAVIDAVEKQLQDAARLLPYTLTKATLSDRTKELIGQLQTKAKGWGILGGGGLTAADRKIIVQEGKMEIIDHLIDSKAWILDGNEVFAVRNLNVDVFNVDDETMALIKGSSDLDKIISVGKFMRRSLEFTQNMATLTKLTPPAPAAKWDQFSDLITAMTNEIARWKADAAGKGGGLTAADREKIVEEGRIDIINHLIDPKKWIVGTVDIFRERTFNIDNLKIDQKSMADIKSETDTGKKQIVGTLLRLSLEFTQDMANLSGVKPPTPATKWDQFSDLINAMTTQITAWKTAAAGKGGAAPAAAGKFTQADIDATVKAETTKAQKTLISKIAADLIGTGGTGKNDFALFDAGFDLSSVTTDAPKLTAPNTTTLKYIGNYYRQCAEAAKLLGSLGTQAGAIAPYADVKDLMNRSEKAIEAKMTAVPAPAGTGSAADAATIAQLRKALADTQTAAAKPAASLQTDLDMIAQLRNDLAAAQKAKPAAPAAAVIAPAIIEGHNGSVTAVVLRFNLSTNKKAFKKSLYPQIEELNLAAAALNATKPATRALVITLTDPTNGDVTNDKENITDTTTAA